MAFSGPNSLCTHGASNFSWNANAHHDRICTVVGITCDHFAAFRLSIENLKVNSSIGSDMVTSPQLDSLH